MQILPTLYKQTKTGKIQQYRVLVEDATIIVEQGQTTGLKQQYTTICTPKNVGKANESSAHVQAILEAQAKHKKKLDTGYTLDPSGEVIVNLPMRVKTYQDQLHNIAEHVYVSDKLNGINGLYRLDNGSLTLYSRGGLPYPELPHLTDDITYLMTKNSLTSLNVELYIHGEYLQDIQSAVTKPNELSPRIQARIFELPDEFGTYQAHQVKLKHISDHYTTEFVSVIPSILVHKSEIEHWYSGAMSRGCEGLIIRNPTGVYKYNERSSDVFKYKKSISSEFKIVGYKIDKNRHPVLICEASDYGQQFAVKPMGTNEIRTRILTALLANPDDYIGEWYTVEFECYSKSGIPLKPVGIALRKVDSEGEALE